MKNLFKYVFMFMVVVMGAVVISSCSKDDDDNSSSSAIVGNWVDNENEPWCFNSNGTGYVTERNHNENFKYKYSESNATLTLYWLDEDDGSVDDTEVKKIVWYGENKFAMYDEGDDDDPTILTRK